MTLTIGAPMRLFFFAAALALTSPAAADPPDAHAALVERWGLLEIDQRCRLLGAGARTALEAGAAQARGALLRSGWTLARVSELESAVTRAARERTCADSRTQTAVADAREAYAHWTRTSVMAFPGWSRTWIARRTTGANGWRLSQAIDTGATFGVREIANAQALSLVLSETSASSARLILRDGRRADPAGLDLPARVAHGLEAGAPAIGAATRTYPSIRAAELATAARPGQVVFTFPSEALQAMLALDPRESVVIELSRARTTERLYVEVGDVGAARAFLTLRADEDR